MLEKIRRAARWACFGSRVRLLIHVRPALAALLLVLATAFAPQPAQASFPVLVRSVYVPVSPITGNPWYYTSLPNQTYMPSRLEACAYSFSVVNNDVYKATNYWMDGDSCFIAYPPRPSYPAPIFGYTAPRIDSWSMCPTNSTSDGLGSCSCNSGYLEQGSQCVPADEDKGGQTCPAMAGNPVFLGTGNKYQREEDFSGPGVLGFVRHYNSAGGGVWSHSYAMRVLSTASAQTVRVVRPDGKEYLFTGSGPGAWSANATVADRLQRLPAGDTSGATWRYTDTDDTVELYDAAGLPLTITYRGGRSLRLQHASGLLQTVSDDFGRRLQFIHDAQGRLSSVTAPGNLTTRYSWDSAGLLRAVTYPDQRGKQYLYENASLPGALTAIIDENNIRFASFAYDAQGRAISSEHAGGTQRYQFSYSATGAAVSEPLGGQRSMQFATVAGHKIYAGQSRVSDQPRGDAAAMQVDPVTGLITQSTDYLGVDTLFTWDSSRKLRTSTTRAAGRPVAQTESTQWHPTFRLPVLVTESGRSTAYTYDARGNPLSQTITDTATGQARTWQWSYTAQGLVRTVTDPMGATWTFGYDGSGNRVSVSNPLGQTTAYAYDAAGRITRQTDPNGLLTSYAWDARGRLTQLNRGGDVSSFTYTPSGQLASATQPDGYAVTYSYDAAQRLIAAQDSLGNSIQYILDSLGNRVSEQVRDGNGNIALATTRVINTLNQLAAVQGAQGQTTALDYDANGQPTSTTDPLQSTTRQTLDALGRSTATTFADSNSASQSWNPLNQLSGVTDPKGVATAYQRNAFGEVMAETSPDIGQLSYQRNASGEVTGQTDAVGNTTTIERDALGRPRRIQWSPTQQALFTWDADQAGYLAAIQDSSGSVSYLRDAQGRILAKTQTVNDNPSSPRQFQLKYGYAGGDLSTISYPSGLQVSYRRINGRISGIDVQPPGRSAVPFVSGLAHTALGQPRSWSWSSGDAASRSFDADGRMTASEIASYSYDAAGRISGITQQLWALNSATGQLSQVPITWSAGYDSRNRLTRFERPGAQNTFGYDANGNRLNMLETVDAGSDIDGVLSHGQLSRTLVQAPVIEPGSNKMTGFHQVGTTASGQGEASVVYSLDANGAITGDGLRRLHYDAAGRLSKVSVADPAGAQEAAVSYLHNALGQRVFKSQVQASQTLPGQDSLQPAFLNYLRQSLGWRLDKRPSATTGLGQAFVYGDAELPDWALLGEYDSASASGKGSVEYIWLPTAEGAMPVGLYRNGKLYAVHADHLGAPRLITDSSNQPVWQWAYSAFGHNQPTGALQASVLADGSTALRPSRPVIDTNLRLPGQYWDEESELSYNLHRSYMPGQGRYTQADPIGLDGGVNRFTYVEGNPLSMTDPLGLMGQGSGANATGGGQYRWNQGPGMSASRFFKNANDLLGHPVPTNKCEANCMWTTVLVCTAAAGSYSAISLGAGLPTAPGVAFACSAVLKKQCYKGAMCEQSCPAL